MCLLSHLPFLVETSQFCHSLSSHFHDADLRNFVNFNSNHSSRASDLAEPSLLETEGEGHQGHNQVLRAARRQGVRGRGQSPPPQHQLWQAQAWLAWRAGLLQIPSQDIYILQWTRESFQVHMLWMEKMKNITFITTLGLRNDLSG